MRYRCTAGDRCRSNAICEPRRCTSRVPCEEVSLSYCLPCVGGSHPHRGDSARQETSRILERPNLRAWGQHIQMTPKDCKSQSLVHVALHRFRPSSTETPHRTGAVKIVGRPANAANHRLQGVPHPHGFRPNSTATPHRIAAMTRTTDILRRHAFTATTSGHCVA